MPAARVAVLWSWAWSVIEDARRKAADAEVAARRALYVTRRAARAAGYVARIRNGRVVVRVPAAREAIP